MIVRIDAVVAGDKPYFPEWRSDMTPISPSALGHTPLDRIPPFTRALFCTSLSSKTASSGGRRRPDCEETHILTRIIALIEEGVSVTSRCNPATPLQWSILILRRPSARHCSVSSPSTTSHHPSNAKSLINVNFFRVRTLQSAITPSHDQRSGIATISLTLCVS